MKRKLTIVMGMAAMALAFALVLAGCGKKEADPGSEIPEIAQGYGIVKWEDSLETVRTAYEIGEDIETKADKDDPAILTLTQEEVSDVIASRMFSFIDDKLYRVTVKYPRKVSSDDLRETLSEKYGPYSDGNVRGIGIDMNRGRIEGDMGMDWENYYPHLRVSLIVYDAHKYQHEVRYTWAEFWENYNYAKLSRVEL